MSTVVWAVKQAVTFIAAGAVLHGQDPPEGGTEGIDWIWGDHEPGSDEAQALLAAWLLRGPRPLDLGQAERLYVAGVLTLEEWQRNLDLWDVEFAAGNVR